MSLTQLVIATHNQGKLSELQALLGSYIAQITSAGALGLPEPVEDGGSFIANARIKAHAAAKASNCPALADDSGLCISALGGRPGVDTANWTKRGTTGLQELIDEMADAPDRSAQSVCVLVLAYPDGRDEVFEGRVDGTLVWPGRGENGFGYDPIFMPAGETRTYAQMSKAEKSALSHRRKALDLLMAYLARSAA